MKHLIYSQDKIIPIKYLNNITYNSSYIIYNNIYQSPNRTLNNLDTPIYPRFYNNLKHSKLLTKKYNETRY